MSGRCWTGAVGSSIRSAMREASRLRRCSAGAAVFGGTPVLRINQQRRAVGDLVTPTGTVTAEKVVLATNGYTGDLWSGLRRSIVPVYSAIVASEPVPDDVMPTRSSLYEMGNITVYYRKDRDNRILMGGRSVQRDVVAAGGIALPDRLRHPALAGVARCAMDACLERATGHHDRPLSAYPRAGGNRPDVPRL